MSFDSEKNHLEIDPSRDAAWSQMRTGLHISYLVELLESMRIVAEQIPCTALQQKLHEATIEARRLQHAEIEANFVRA